MIGPELGTLIGMKMASSDALYESHSEELGVMRAQLRAIITSQLYDMAFARAAADLTAEILSELKAEKEGKGKVAARRLSDPANTEIRNQEYVRRAAKHYYLASKGRESMPSAHRERFTAQRLLK